MLPLLDYVVVSGAGLTLKSIWLTLNSESGILGSAVVDTKIDLGCQLQAVPLTLNRSNTLITRLTVTDCKLTLNAETSRIRD
jgi:hypothetical protein